MLRLILTVGLLLFSLTAHAGTAQEVVCMAQQGNSCTQSMCQEDALYKVVFSVDLEANEVTVLSAETLRKGQEALPPDIRYEIVERSPVTGPAGHEFFVVARARLAPHTYETLVIGEYSYLSTRLVGPPTARVHSLVGNCKGLEAPQPGITRSGHPASPSQPGVAGGRPQSSSR
jgi:hypothetical protein